MVSDRHKHLFWSHPANLQPLTLFFFLSEGANEPSVEPNFQPLTFFPSCRQTQVGWFISEILSFFYVCTRRNFLIGNMFSHFLQFSFQTKVLILILIFPGLHISYFQDMELSVYLLNFFLKGSLDSSLYTSKSSSDTASRKVNWNCCTYWVWVTSLSWFSSWNFPMIFCVEDFSSGMWYSQDSAGST